MPQVPVYDIPRVDYAAQPSARFDFNPVQDVAGKQLQGFGDAALKGGAAMKTIADKIQADKDDAATKEMDNKLAEAYRNILHDKDNGYMTSLGKNAVDGRDGVAEAIRKARESVESGITDEFQRMLFKNVADRRTESAMLQVDSHAAQQTKIWHEGESVARVKSSVADAVANSQGWNIPDSPYAVAKKTALAEVDALSELRGYDTAQRDQLRSQTLAGMSETVLRNMVSLGQSKTARDYLEATAPDIAKGAPDRLDDLRNLVKTAGVKDEAIGLAQTLKGGLQQQVKQLDEMVANGRITAEVYDNARQRVEHNWQLKKTMENEGNKAMMGNIQMWSLQPENRNKSILDAPPAYLAWAKSQGKLSEWDSFHQREGRPGNRRDELVTRGQLLNMASTDPDAFIAEFKKDGFLGRMDLGASGIKEMQNIATDIQRNGGKYHQQFTPAVLQDGIPKALLARDKKDEKDAFTAIMAEEQQKWIKANPGKTPTEADHAKVIQAANQEWTSIGRIWNSTVPAYKVRASGDKNAVPADFYKGMKAAGASEDEIIKAWTIRQGTR
jgi:hypothetical protein